jgi:hypothetical protein
VEPLKRSSLLLPLLMALGGAVWTAGQALLPDMGFAWADRLAAIAADRPGQALSAGAFVLAGVLLVAAAVVASRATPAGRGAGLSRAGVLLLGFGGVWLAAGRGAFNLLTYRLTDPSVERAAALEVAAADVGSGFVVLVLMLPALLLGPVLLAAGLIRAGAGGPAWAALACWAAGVGAFVVSEFSVKAVEVAGLAVATVGLALLGVVLTRRAVSDALTARPGPAVRV